METKKSKRESNFTILKKARNNAIIGISFFKWVIIGCIVGIFTGLTIALFLKSLETAAEIRTSMPWILFFLPAGGAFVSFMYSKYGKNSSKGNNLIIEKINESDGNIPLRMAPLVFMGTFITHLFGGSAGREGTGVQIGASISEGIGKLFKLDKTDTKIILMCGISSGFGSIFGTPLAGTVFGLEVATLGAMSYEALIPCFTAAFVGNFVTEIFGIHHSHYSILNIPDMTYGIVFKIILASVLFGLTSKLFSEITHKLKEIFSSGFQNSSIKSFMGGLTIIALTYIIGTRDYLGLSLPLISDSFKSHVNPFAFLIKIIFTSITIGTGFQGGEVTPLFVIGSTLGNSLSNVLHLTPSFLAALGLIGVFAGATNAPITSFILGIEMFGSSGSIYLFMTCAISYIFSGHSGIYTSQKISISKSKLIKTPINATLSYMKKENIKIMPVRGSQILSGQFKFGTSSIELPAAEGLNVYKIFTKGSGIRLIHHSYNPDGGAWTANPVNGKVKYIKLKPNKEEMHAITINKVYGYKDKILLVNTNLFKSIEIKYMAEQHNNEVVNEISKLKNELEEVILENQFKFWKNSIVLPGGNGENIYKIIVTEGKIRLCHNSYNEDGHTWSAPPNNGEVQYMDLEEGEHIIKILIKESFGKPDKIKLVNLSFKNNTKVQYSVEKYMEDFEEMDNID